MTNVLSKWKQNEKGFTLVELLAVIVILGIILAIAIPAIGGIINKAKDNTEENQEELIVDAARLADANGDFTDTEMKVTELISKGYLEDFDDSEYEEDFKSGSVKKNTSDTSVTYEYEAGTGSGGSGGS